MMVGTGLIIILNDGSIESLPVILKHIRILKSISTVVNLQSLVGYWLAPLARSHMLSNDHCSLQQLQVMYHHSQALTIMSYYK